MRFAATAAVTMMEKARISASPSVPGGLDPRGAQSLGISAGCTYGLSSVLRIWPAVIARVARGSEGIPQAFPSAQPTS
jgi:hypothetical protein